LAQKTPLNHLGRLGSRALTGQDKKILAAYRSIFPQMTPELAEYWGLSRQRDWSVVTSDFHSASYDKFKSLHEHVVKIDNQGLAPKSKGEALRAAAISCGVGYSMGISPWTDHLLYETYSDDKDSVTILLGQIRGLVRHDACRRYD
jgi:hypothetical protein